MNERTLSANRVTWLGFFTNLFLTAFKLVAGILGHSGAMIADAIHSFSDFASDIVVLVSFKVVDRPADRTHDYGHGKYETLATAAVGGSLLLVGVWILWGGATKILGGIGGQHIETPGGDCTHRHCCFDRFEGVVVSLYKEGRGAHRQSGCYRQCMASPLRCVFIGRHDDWNRRGDSAG